MLQIFYNYYNYNSYGTLRTIDIGVFGSVGCCLAVRAVV